MARFSGKIENLRYADEQHKSIEILYKNVETINSYHIEVDYTNQDFLDLLEEYSIEDIEEGYLCDKRSFLRQPSIRRP